MTRTLTATANEPWQGYTTRVYRTEGSTSSAFLPRSSLSMKTRLCLPTSSCLLEHTYLSRSSAPHTPSPLLSPAFSDATESACVSFLFYHISRMPYPSGYDQSCSFTFHKVPETEFPWCFYYITALVCLTERLNFLCKSIPGVLCLSFLHQATMPASIQSVGTSFLNIQTQILCQHSATTSSPCQHFTVTLVSPRLPMTNFLEILSRVHSLSALLCVTGRVIAIFDSADLNFYKIFL